MSVGPNETVSTRLILASASPRRLKLLRQIGIVVDDVIPAEIDETPVRNELPRATALRLSEGKARAVASRHDTAYVIGADTIVGCGRRILPKAEKEDEARRFLALLSGRRHRVYGGVTLIAPGGRMASRLVQTVVAFKRLNSAEIEGYLASGEWRDKAGAYAIQGLAATFVRWISGSYSNVVGLPLFETAALLSSHGFAWRTDGMAQIQYADGDR
ncbi:MAG: septum formation protein Maf [Rhodospirillales bacterium]|nr:septum formation protein Maf [Rhodospirillales bacterium]